MGFTLNDTLVKAGTETRIQYPHTWKPSIASTETARSRI